MLSFIRKAGEAVVLPMDNIDTDQLIPARFMNRPRCEGYGGFLFYDMRFDSDGHIKPEFPLNDRDQPPMVLIAGANFGCGSSREAAVYALMDFGIRVVISTSFADIFRNNSYKNGLLLVDIDADSYKFIILKLKNYPRVILDIDLENQKFSFEGESVNINFEIDPIVKGKLINGLDDISETIDQIDRIENFKCMYFSENKWILINHIII